MPDARGVIFKRRDDLAFDAKDAELLRSADLAHYLPPFTDYKALAQERSAGGRVVAECPYVRKFVHEHPEWRDVVEGEVGPSNP